MTRLLTALVLIAVVLSAIFSGSPWFLLGVVALIASLAFIEYTQILRIDSHLRLLGVFAGLGLLAMPTERVYLALLLFALLVAALPLRKTDLANGFAQSAALFLGVVYIFGAMKTVLQLSSRGPWWLLFSLAIAWIGDSGAYYIGRQFGRHKLAPRISPGKSWEGALASAACSIVFFVIVGQRWLHIAPGIAALLALAGNIAGQIGDLSESALKRAVGVKDSGTLLPGHGGMLDRIDGTLFVLPVVYALVVWWQL